ncbi:MAG: glycoside hydrolase, partial [Thermoguttaceae bacterium]|nr:glycoside hydrolase [Thermoguttaceae bacterium]
MALSPAKGDRVVFGTSGHVFLTDSAGDTWQQRYCQIEGDRVRGTGLEGTCFNDVVTDPGDPGRLYFCYYDIGLLVSDDYGRSFQKTGQGMRHAGNCFTVVVDPVDPEQLWAGTGQWGSNQGDVCRSEDRGRSWTVVGKPETGLPVGQTKTLILDVTSPVDRRVLYVTSQGNGVFRSDDSGDSWQPVGGGLPP